MNAEQRSERSFRKPVRDCYEGLAVQPSWPYKMKNNGGIAMNKQEQLQKVLQEQMTGKN